MNAEHTIAKASAAAAALKDALKATLGDDLDAVRDVIEGETTLHESIALVMNSIREDETLVGGIAQMMQTLDARKARLDTRIERKRAAIEQAMQIGEIKNLELPDCTLTLKMVPPKVEIIDEAKIPARFWKNQEPVLDKKSLNEAVKTAAAEKQTIPGAQIGNGSISLQVRRS